MTHTRMDKAIEEAYLRLAKGKRIKITDIGKLFADARYDMMQGMTAEDAVAKAIEKYCEAAS